MTLPSSRAFFRLAVTEAAAVAIWAFVMNRSIIHWVDSPVKWAVQAGVGLALVALALLSVRSRTDRWTWAALAVLTVFGLGEIRRVVLRGTYGAPVEMSSLAEVMDPINTTDLAVRHFSIEVPTLTAPRVRVAHVTDLHITDDLPKAYFDGLAAELRSLAPDLIVMTGDYVSKAERIGLFSEWLAALPRPPGGAFATLGNHDYWTEHPGDVRAALERAGVRIVTGRCELARVRGASVRLCGTEEPWGPGLDLRAAGESPAPTLVLSHTPDNIYALSSGGATAVFAGHTHGGQFRVPFLGALIVPSQYGRRFDRGHFVVQGTHLFVSAGVGADSPPLRLWCPPELVVVDLVGGAERIALEAN